VLAKRAASYLNF